ncbi:PAS domain-containing protein [Dyella sp. 20L07]|uniref:PAS domain-containing protein n=1 Tax=Dyella sp. 20L07 TaxID=3384240 RepID=UPI003D28A6BE
MGLSRDCVLALNRDRRITSISATVCRIFRAWRPEEVLGNPWESLWTQPTLDRAGIATYVPFSRSAEI